MAASLMNRLRSMVLGAADSAGVATVRFPIAALLIMAIALFANLAIEDIYPIGEEDMAWLVASLFGAASASVAMRLAAESHGLRPLYLALTPAAAGIVAGLVIWNSAALDVLAPPFAAALTLAIPLAPYVARPDDKRFWTFTLWGTVGVTLAFLSVLLFVLGVSAILEMVRYLFDVGLSSTAYEHIYATALALVGPLFALGRVPVDFEESVPVGEDDRLTAGVRFLFDWVGAPLALATAVVLHLYAAKIAFSGELPKNEIGWIVSFYALLVLSFRVAIDPFVETRAAVTTRVFGSAWAPMLIVPVGLLAYAAGIRILAEGVTLERYYLGLGATAAALVLLAQIPPRTRGDIRMMSGIPILLLALSSFGPWGASDVVGRSQVAMIRSDFAKGDPTIDVAALGEAERDVLRSRLGALDDADEIARVLPLLPETARAQIAARAAGEDLHAAVNAALKLDYGQPSVPAVSYVTLSAGRLAGLDTTGYDTALLERSLVVDSPWMPEDALQAGLRVVGDELLVRLAGSQDRVALKPLLEAIPEPALSASADSRGVAPVDMELTTAAGRKVKARLSYAVLESPVRRPVQMTLTLLLRRADWPASKPAASLGGEADAGGGGGRQSEPSGAVGEGAR